MRKSTGAYIRILGKDQLPKGASDNEEVVQVCFYLVYALNEFDYHDSFGIWMCLVTFSMITCVICPCASSHAIGLLF